MAAGSLAVFVLGAWNAPVPFASSYSVSPVRLFAVVLAVLWSMIADSLLHIDHAATEAATILLASGFFHTAADALAVAPAARPAVRRLQRILDHAGVSTGNAVGATVAPAAGRTADRRTPRFVVANAIATVLLAFAAFWMLGNCLWGS